MKARLTYRCFLFLGILYIFVDTFVYYRMIITDGQEFISLIGGVILDLIIFVYMIIKIRKGSKKILLEEENYWAVGRFFIKVERTSIFSVIYSMLQLKFHTDYSVLYGISIFFPSMILFLWSYAEIKEINNRYYK